MAVTTPAPVRVKKTTTAPAADSATKKADKTDAPVKASKYKGRTTGMRVMEFQDSTFAANVTAMKTDEELAALWRAEFPGAVAFQTFHVKGARRDYNAGRHAKATPKPATPLDEVVIVDGKRVWAASVEKKAEPKADKKAAAPAADKAAPVVKVAKAAKKTKAA